MWNIWYSVTDLRHKYLNMRVVAMVQQSLYTCLANSVNTGDLASSVMEGTLHLLQLQRKFKKRPLACRRQITCRQLLTAEEAHSFVGII